MNYRYPQYLVIELSSLKKFRFSGKNTSLSGVVGIKFADISPINLALYTGTPSGSATGRPVMVYLKNTAVIMTEKRHG